MDLNDITANGTYTIGVPSSIENLPDTRGYGILSVFKGEKDIANSGYVLQVYVQMYSNTVYLRSRIETGVWKDWIQLVTQTATSATVSKTQYAGSRSVDVSTAGKLTFIFSSTYSSHAGCYLLLGNYNTAPLLIPLGSTQNNFAVTATHVSNGVDRVNVTMAGGSDYTWYIVQI